MVSPMRNSTDLDLRGLFANFDSAVANGQLDDIEKGVRDILSATPDSADARALMAKIRFQNNDWAEASFQAREALRIDPDLTLIVQPIIVDCQKQTANMLTNPDDEGLLWFIDRTVQRYPDAAADYENLQDAIEKFVLPGWLPDARPFKQDSKILALGSCFATKLRTYMENKGISSSGIWVPEGLNNTYSLRQFIQWSVSGTLSDNAYWYDAHEGRGVKWTPSHEQEKYKNLFETASGFVITVGLAEVWEDLETGGVFWRGVPKSIYEPGRYKLRMTTVEENESNLRGIIDELKQIDESKPIILTLSPIPLRATFHNTSCMVMDCVSKSILRVAIANVMNEGNENVYYWPSFEIVKWVGCHISEPVFGQDAVDQRHLSRFVPELVIDKFIEHYFA